MTWDTPLLDDGTAVGYEHRGYLAPSDHSGNPTLLARADVQPGGGEKPVIKTMKN